MIKFPLRRSLGDKPLTPLGSAAPAISSVSPAALDAEALAPLTAEAEALFVHAFQIGEPGRVKIILERRLRGVAVVSEPLDPHARFTPLRIAPGEVTLQVEPDLAGTPLAYKYHRLAAMLPFLSYVAQKVTRSGRLDLDLSDGGEPDKLAFSSTSDSPLLPDPLFLGSGGYAAERAAAASAPDWEARDPRVLWRGSTTGHRTQDWRSLQRAQLCRLASEAVHAQDYDVGFNAVVQAWTDTEAEEIRGAGFMRPSVPSTRFQNFRYHVDIDGNSNSWGGLFIKLLSGGLVFKVASPFKHRQWYYRRLQPWLHYVPIDASLSDLREVVGWAKANSARAAEIAAAGQQLAQAMTLEGEAHFGLAVVEQALASAWRGA